MKQGKLSRRKIQDFKKKKKSKVEPLTIIMDRSHEADLAWLLSEMESIQSKNKIQNKKRSILVVTHHAPSLQDSSSPQHANNPWSSAFATDILSQISKSSGVKAWAFGHTHFTTEFKNQGIRVVANQRGYVLPCNNPKGSQDGFDVEKVIHIWYGAASLF